MVTLTLTPHRGNGARNFPSIGYLGLSPVTLAGVVRVKIQEDNKSIQASSLVVRVRCYETVGGSSNQASSSSASASSSTTTTTSVNGSSTAVTPSATNSNSASTSNAFIPFSGSGSNSGTTTSYQSCHPSSSSAPSSSSSTPSRGRVLYEKNLTLWLPPQSSSTSTSTSSSSPSPPSTSACSSSSCSRSSSVDRDPSSHAYPPKSRRESHNTATSTSNNDNDDHAPTYGTLGEFPKAFRLVIPPEAVHQGAKSTMIFKNWRVWWAIEAVIAHKNLGVLGDRIVRSHQVNLISYAPAPTPSIPLEWVSPTTSEGAASEASTSGTNSTSTSHYPAGRSPILPLSYSITSNNSAFGSSDPISFNVKLTKRSHMTETPRKVVLELRREICFASTESPISSSHHSFESPNQQQHLQHQPQSSVTNGKSKRTSYFSNRHSRGLSHPASLGSSSGSGGGNNTSLASTLGSSTNKYKSESQEALISPPLLSNTSTTSTNSIMPATPPLQIPTPIEYSEGTTESYFGLFKNNHGVTLASPTSKASSKNVHHHHHHQAQGQAVIPKHIQSVPAPIAAVPMALKLPASAQQQHQITSSSSKRKKEDVSLATFEIDCLFTSSSWSGTIQGQMPKAKSLYHYALGETCSTLSADSRFYIIPRIHYKSKQTPILELSPLDLKFSTVSLEDRQKAQEMLPKVLGTQKAEAKLFEGIEVREKVVTVSSTAPGRGGGENSAKLSSAAGQSRSSNVYLQVGSSGTSTTLDSIGASSVTSSRSRSHQKPLEARRDRVSKSVSPKSQGFMPTGMSSSPPSADQEEVLFFHDRNNCVDDEGESSMRGNVNNIRRRSEQPDSYEATRTRRRYGGDAGGSTTPPDLSPVVGSPYIDAVSPSLSIISSSTMTTRPRTGGSRRPNTGNSSIKSTSGIFHGNTHWSSSSRPRSAAGLEASNSSIGSIPSGRFSHISTFEDLCRIGSNGASSGSHVPNTSSSTSIPTTSNLSNVTASAAAASHIPLMQTEEDDDDEDHSDTPSATRSAPPILLEYPASPRSISSSSLNGSSPEISLSPSSTSTSGKQNNVPNYTTAIDTTGIGSNSTVNGLFAEFNGFHLKSSTPPTMKEKLIPPKYNGSSSSSKRKSVEISSESRSSSNSKTSLTSSSFSSAAERINGNERHGEGSIAMREITLGVPPESINMNPNASSNGLLVPDSIGMSMGLGIGRSSSPMSKASSDTSVLESGSMTRHIGNGTRPGILGHDHPSHSSHSSSSSSRRIKSGGGGMASAFSFFRRSSTKT